MTTESSRRLAGWHSGCRVGSCLAILSRSAGFRAWAREHSSPPCWFTFDPVSLLITSHYDPVIPEISAEFLAHEYRDDDVLKMASVARSGTGVATIHEVTGGDPSRSPGWRAFVQPYGGDQQLMVTLRSKPGEPWGLLALYREAGGHRPGAPSAAAPRCPGPQPARHRGKPPDQASRRPGAR